jgi:chloramphenicol-sensitive protein RarD
MTLCISFGVYGLLRKKSGTAAIPGLFFETVLLTPVALGYLLFRHWNGELFFGQIALWPTLLLVSTGVVTAVPLVWFGYATRYLRLTTVGFLQYLAPSGSFCLGVFVYHEPFTRGHLITFILIWAGLIIFTVEAVVRWRSARAQEALEEAVCKAPV